MAGSKGKTSVLRAVESIFRAGGYRFASWTDRGVEIEGEHQRGELGPWSRALTRLAAGGLDIALQELDWATVPTVGAPGAKYPIVAIANLCGNSEACFFTPETRASAASAPAHRSRALRPLAGWSLTRMTLRSRTSVTSPKTGARYLVGISADAPVLRRHILHGGDACWVENGSITIRESGCVRSRLPKFAGCPRHETARSRSPSRTH